MQVREFAERHSARARAQGNFSPLPAVAAQHFRGPRQPLNRSPAAQPLTWCQPADVVLPIDGAALHHTVAQAIMATAMVASATAAAGVALHNAQPDVYNCLQLIWRNRLRGCRRLWSTRGPPMVGVGDSHDDTEIPWQFCHGH